MGRTGDPIGGQFTVGVEDYEYNSAVSEQGGDRFIVVWGDGAGVYGRLFGSVMIFEDGFETGAGSAWSEVSF